MRHFKYLIGTCSIIILTLCYLTGVTLLLYNFFATSLSFSSFIGLFVAIILMHPVEETLLNFLSKHFDFYKKLKEKERNL